MKRLIWLIVAVFLFMFVLALNAHAQVNTTYMTGVLSKSSTSCTSIYMDSTNTASGECVSIALPPNTVSAAVTLSGTFSLTATFEVSANYGVTWVAASTTSSASVGTSVLSVAGYNFVRARCSAYTSGAAQVAIQTAAASGNIGTLNFTDTNVLAWYQNSVNSYNQVIVQNTNTGTTASANFVAGVSTMTATTNYIEMGMNSSGFTGSGSLSAANMGYLDTTSQDLSIGTTTNNSVHFVTNNAATDSASISGAGAWTFNGNVKVTTLNSATVCNVNSASPAACSAAASGAVVIPTTTTTYTVNTTAVTAHSLVYLWPRTYTGDLPSAPTCVAPAVTSAPVVSAIVAATSFTITLPSTSGQTCWNYLVIN